MKKKTNQEYISQLISELSRTDDLNKYELGNVSYISATSKVNVKCKIHGDWYVAPNHVLNGRRCPKCKSETLSSLFRKDTSKVESQAAQAHAGKYSFVDINADYVNNESPVRILCPEHGEFVKSMNHFIDRYQGCPSCYKDSIKEPWNKKTKDEFFKECILLERDNLSLDKFEYVNAKTKGTVTCSVHGDFEVTPDAFKHSKSGCPSCSPQVSATELELRRYIKDLGFNAEYNVPILEGKHIDIYLPDIKVGIEYSGLYSHGELRKTSKDYHLNKFISAKSKGIFLIQIFGDEWQHLRGKVEKCLQIRLGISTESVGARKLLAKSISLKEANEVYSENHLQSEVYGASFNYGLLDASGKILSAMSFSPLKGGSCELVRFSSHGRILGGFSKLLKLAKVELKAQGISTIMSFSDNRWSLGNVYEKAGFIHSGISAPRYWWVQGSIRHHRRGFQRKYLPQKLKVFKEELSESENCRANGLYKIWDAGVTKWILDI